MHIPDGYLSPATSGAMYVAVAPFWAVAAHRVRGAVGGRTAPLLAIFAAFAFAIMMFNVPVPGGTTAHGVGGTLAAIVLGPWAAVLATSVALILQALFFGDGGILAIGANCFNMGVALPLTGYAVYRLLAGRSGALAQRRVVAAAIGAYVGITVAALLVGLQLGLQPHIASTNGVPDYSPYGFGTAITSMMVAHLVGASFVEAAITALAVAYLQRSYPELLLRRAPAEPSTAAMRAANPWAPVIGFTAVAALVVVVAGVIAGHGDLARWGGVNWSGVDGTGVLTTVAVSALATAVVLPAVWWLLRDVPALRTPVLIFAGILVWTPIGLIAPGGAFGEDASATPEEVAVALQARAAGDSRLFDALPDVNQECACVPNKINDFDLASGTLLAGYQPPWVHETDPAWQQNIGYQLAGLLGIAGLGALMYAVYRAARRLAPAAPPDWRTAE